ncbi:MAG: sulfatase-like hydrolase/transferase [Candidatus Aminicenantales bacterium]
MKAGKLLIFVAAGVALAGAAGYWLLSSRAPSLARLRRDRDFNVIVITLDTTRADRLACYGCQDVSTPTIDRFAARGVRFEKAYAQTPLTLPSHTSLMTGTLPLFHGVRDNGGFVVPEKLKTMAELFEDKGYETGAFIAAYVLDSKWGLNQGFETYFDKFDLRKFKRISLGTVQRPANEVMDEALPWLEARKDKRFFAWIHLYDPHSPYEPPPPYDKLYADRPYLGEIAFADSQIDRLWSLLERDGLLEKTFIVFAGDHGESLWEHEEQSHGFFVYQAAIHVPLIIVTPFPKLQGVVSSDVASLSDVLPTVCEMVGLPIPAEVQGKSLLPDFFGRRRAAAPLSYSETYYPRFHYGWSDLKSVQDGRYKLILAPVPELYDVAADPREEKNLVYLEKAVYERMNAEAEAFISASSRNAYETDFSKIDEETREKLAALGYIGSFADPAKLKGKKLANPREKIGVFNQLSEARELGMNGKPEEAIKIIQGIIADDPDITDAYFSIGNIYFQEQKYKEAGEYFRQVLGRKPDDTFAAINVALSYEGQGDFDAAEKFLLEYIAKGFPDPQFYFMLGNLSFIRKEYDKAIPYFEKCIAVNSESAGSYNVLAAIYITKGDLERAESCLAEASRLNPTLANLHYNRAQIDEKRGDNRAAEAEYLKELESSPKHFKALYNLSRLYRAVGDEAKELDYLKQCLDVDPRFPLTYFYLARINLNRGERYEEAIDLVKKGIELKPETSELPLGYFLLADLYNRVGENALSEENARRGQAAAAAAAAAARK